MKYKMIIFAGSGAVLAVIGLYLLLDPECGMDFVVDRETHWAVFVGLMAILPIFAFPISVFLVLSGIKFGFLAGSLVTVLVMPVHLIASFVLANSLLRPYLIQMLDKKNLRVPQIPKDRMLIYTSLFVIVPGPPYFLKNYLLAISGVPFRYYFGVNWVLELLICIPVVGLGESLMKTSWKLIIFVVFIAALYLTGRWLKGKFVG
jgi:uncharacterized membrane protein YdjX (TVP38/TMEM64 family)